MSAASHYYRKAIFRSGVEYLVGDKRAVFRYDMTSFDIECNRAAAEEIAQLCSSLAEGLDLEICGVLQKSVAAGFLFFQI